MKSKMFELIKMNSEAKKALVINPRLRLMSNITSRPKKIKRKIVLMDEVKKSDGLSLEEVKKLKKGKNLHMDTFSKIQSVKSLKVFPEQEALKAIKVIDVQYHIQLRMQVKNGEVKITGARKVEGGFIKETKLHLNEGLVYEVSKGRKRLQFGVIPDFGEWRGFPHPSPKTEAEKGHSISEMKELDFNVRVLPKELSLASLKSLKIVLYRAKSAVSSEVSNVSLDKQFDNKLRKIATMQRIHVTKISKTLQKSFQNALK